MTNRKVGQTINAIQSDVEEFATLLLDDDEGINEEAFNMLCILAARFKSKKLEDLTQAVKATEGRFYLPKT